MHTRITTRDPEAIIWLQRALNLLLPWPRPFIVGELDAMTMKGIQAYQFMHGLPKINRLMPQGGEVPPELVQHIKDQLAARGLTVS